MKRPLEYLKRIACSKSDFWPHRDFCPSREFTYVLCVNDLAIECESVAMDCELDGNGRGMRG